MNEGEKRINVLCFKFDPTQESESKFVQYRVPYKECQSVLDVLEYIYENLDSSLAFYASCRRGVCSRCYVKVNGKICLACDEEVTGDLKIEPVNAKKVIRDLKIDDLVSDV